MTNKYSKGLLKVGSIAILSVCGIVLSQQVNKTPFSITANAETEQNGTGTPTGVSEQNQVALSANTAARESISTDSKAVGSQTSNVSDLAAGQHVAENGQTDGNDNPDQSGQTTESSQTGVTGQNGGNSSRAGSATPAASKTVDVGANSATDNVAGKTVISAQTGDATVNDSDLTAQQSTTPESTTTNAVQPTAFAKMAVLADPNPEPAVATSELIVHYQPKSGDTTAREVYVWTDTVAGAFYQFTSSDQFGQVAQIPVAGDPDKINFIISTEDWNKDGGDRSVATTGGLGEAWVVGGQDTTLTTPPSTDVTPSYRSVNVTVHYYRDDQNYTGWNIYTWPNTGDGVGHDFTSTDDYGQVANFTVSAGTPFNQIGVIVRQSTADNEWAAKDIDADRFLQYGLIHDNGDGTGTAEVWLAQDDPSIYINPTLINRTAQIKSASVDTFNTIKVTVNKPFELANIQNQITWDGGTIQSVATDPDAPTTGLIITTANDVDLRHPGTITMGDYGNAAVTLGNVVRSTAFDDKYAYSGTLGAQYTVSQTDFRLWAPTATSVTLVTYAGDAPDSPIASETPMNASEKGTWDYVLHGDQKDLVYTYRLTFSDGTVNNTIDPYATAAIVNGSRGVVLAPDEMVPANWGARMPAFTSPTDAVITEMDIRDFSIAANSGITDKGKYLGVIQSGTKTTDGNTSGLDYLVQSGTTHVQIMPMYDFNSVDESKPDVPQYNWGYDPLNYNVPEGSYSTDATNPATRVVEAKEMIQGLHDKGLRVIMDVVYNHVADPNSQALALTVPGYYFRYDANGKLSNGTGVGNDVASERAMARKYIVDSVTYWAKNYNLDGFRFDLMGILDVDTMNAIRDALNKIDPSIIVLGEGWDLSTTLPADQKADQKNADKTSDQIAYFNDSIRDAIKGSVFNATDPGFVSGKQGVETLLAANVLGGQNLDPSLSTYTSPQQLVQYVEAHDNLTLYDKLVATSPDASAGTIAKQDMLANSIILLSQGVPFMQIGQDFMRTKGGNDNSYNAPDSVNEIDWDRAATYGNNVQYIRNLIAFRKATPALRYTSYDAINANTKLLKAADQIVAYQTKDETGTYMIMFNANPNANTMALPNGQYHVMVKDDQVDLNGSQMVDVTDGQVSIDGLSTLVLKLAKADTSGGETGENTGSNSGNTGNIGDTGNAGHSSGTGNSTGTNTSNTGTTPGDQSTVGTGGKLTSGTADNGGTAMNSPEAGQNGADRGSSENGSLAVGQQQSSNPTAVNGMVVAGQTGQTDATSHKNQILPQTNESGSSLLALIGVSLMSLMSALGIREKKRRN